MANQYSGSFEHKIKQRFQCTAKEFLEKFAQENLSYNEVEKRIGFTHGTIRKWARRYGITLNSAQAKNQAIDNNRLFLDPSINTFNYLSRKWRMNG